MRFVAERTLTSIENVFQVDPLERLDGEQMNNSFPAKEPEQDMEKVNEKPDIACHFLDVVLDAEIGNTGFRCCDSSIQQLPVQLS